MWQPADFLPDPSAADFRDQVCIDMGGCGACGSGGVWGGGRVWDGGAGGCEVGLRWRQCTLFTLWFACHATRPFSGAAGLPGAHARMPLPSHTLTLTHPLTHPATPIKHQAQVLELRSRAASIPDELLVVLVGDMVTEEALPTYMAMLNTLDGWRDESGQDPGAYARWTRWVHCDSLFFVFNWFFCCCWGGAWIGALLFVLSMTSMSAGGGWECWLQLHIMQV